MSILRATLRWTIVLVPVLVGGCASMFQTSDTVLIREPGYRTYAPPAPVSESARTLWEYAVLSENVYIGEWKKRRAAAPSQEARPLRLPEATPQAYVDSCVKERIGPLPLPGWKMWEGFPSPKTIQEALRVGLFVEVWEKESSPAVIAVVFRGTEATSWKDWVSNLRWFLPRHTDQYSLVAQRVGKEFVDRLVKDRPGIKSTGGPEVRIVATGHSLGGGLAQHFAYSMPPASSEGIPLPRTSSVYAFDPSPVTGWYSLDSALRTANAKGLTTDRAFEHGEILAYARLLLGYVNPPSTADPAIREIRFNFVRTWNIFKNHSMRFLACALIDASGEARLPGLRERFDN